MACSFQPALAALAALGLLVACDPAPDVAPDEAPAAGKADDIDVHACEGWDEPLSLGEVGDHRAIGLSGLLVSHRDPAVLWAVNDATASKDRRLFAFDRHGEVVALQPVVAEASGGLDARFVAADIAWDGSGLIGQVDGGDSRLWQRHPGEPWASALSWAPCQYDAPDLHIETIALGPDGSYWMIPEGREPPVFEASL